MMGDFGGDPVVILLIAVSLPFPASACRSFSSAGEASSSRRFSSSSSDTPLSQSSLSLQSAALASSNSYSVSAFSPSGLGQAYFQSVLILSFKNLMTEVFALTRSLLDRSAS